MKIILISLVLLSATVFGKSYVLKNADAQYTVKHIFKTVKGESKELKGKMVCENSLCEFLVAVPSKSFVSSDSNRDLNMRTILETSKYPVVTVKGKIPEADLKKYQFTFDALVNLHGVEKKYPVNIKMGPPSKGSLVLLLESHKVERPSLLTAKIDNEVPIDFSFEWKE